MLGVTTLEFALQGNFDQRTYELTYATAEPGGSCISGARTGGSDAFLSWVDEYVIPAAVAKLGMLRGEVTIAGGSLGGLTSCYAASRFPNSFSRAICMSPSNCFNYVTGGLAPVIASNFKLTGSIPKAVVQFLGAESYVELFGGESQLDFLEQDESAWRGIGMTAAPVATSYTPGDPSGDTPYGYSALQDAPAHQVASFLLPGGQHSPFTWQREFSTALGLIYRSSPQDPQRPPPSTTLRRM